MSKKDLDYKTESSDFSFADRYLQDRRFPKWIRIKAKFPLVEGDRRVANIDYASDELRRSYRGQVPKIPIDFNNLTTARVETLGDSKYKFVSNAPNASNVPKGFYGTSSGIYPIDFEPFSIGLPTNIPIEINEDYKPESTVSGEFFFVLLDNYREIKQTVYYTVDSGSRGTMMEWEFDPLFQNPTEPAVRYPKNGAHRRLNNR